MNTVVVRKNFAVKPVVAAVSLAFSAVTAYAAPTPNQLPGAGTVTAVSIGTTVAATAGYAGGGGAGATLTNATTPAVLTLTGGAGKAVITWGGTDAFGNSGVIDTINPAGFNIGAAGKLTFAAAGTGTHPAVLNIDASGNLSQIVGQLESTGPAVFVANTNGILVSAGARIALPNGGGLIGANLNNKTAVWDFVGNNGWVSPAAPAYGVSYLDPVSGYSNVTINGAINGSLTLNEPASYILVVGGDIVNTGNLYAEDVHLVAGLRAVGSTAAVNGTAGTAVNRLWNVDGSGHMQASDALGLPNGIEFAGPGGGTIVNTGSISSNNGAVYGLARVGFRSGSAGSTDQTIGIFADEGLKINTYTPTGWTELYNVVSGYQTTPVRFLDSLEINQAFGSTGNVRINALTRNSQPSSITTVNDVRITGNTVEILSTINAFHYNATGIYLSDNDLEITSHQSLTITANVGSGANVRINNYGSGGINISGNVESNLDDYNYGWGTVEIHNHADGAPTTISGNVSDNWATSGWAHNDYGVDIHVNGPLTISGDVTSQASKHGIHIANYKVGATTSISGDVYSGGWANSEGGVFIETNGHTTISGDVTALHGWVDIYNFGTQSNLTTLITGDVYGGDGVDIYHYGPVGSPASVLTIDGHVSSDGDIYIYSQGNLVLGSGGVTSWDGDINVTVLGREVTIGGPQSAWDEYDFEARNAFTKLLPNGTIEAWRVWMDVNNLQGVNANGNAYTSAAQKPAWQIMTNRLDIDATGSVNAPIAGNTNWLLNQLQVKALDSNLPIDFTFSARGAGQQFWNLGFTGDVFVSSGDTYTPFEAVGLTTGTTAAGGLIGNGGSQMILNASGTMDIYGGSNPGGTPGSFFQFPGGLVFKSGSVLTQHDPVYNAWTTVAQPYQGVFFEAPVINNFAYIATNGNSWANWNVQPTTPVPQVYQITQPLPTTLAFVLATDAPHQNTYSLLITGTPVNTCPVSVCGWQ